MQRWHPRRDPSLPQHNPGTGYKGAVSGCKGAVSGCVCLGKQRVLLGAEVTTGRWLQFLLALCLACTRAFIFVLVVPQILSPRRNMRKMNPFRHIGFTSMFITDAPLPPPPRGSLLGALTLWWLAASAEHLAGTRNKHIPQPHRALRSWARSPQAYCLWGFHLTVRMSFPKPRFGGVSPNPVRFLG